ncbi:MAG TPA: RNA polymerase sigma factor [Acidimicrobiales bacterium]|nr:RNA polymerase sigma factor [Acidimicrobiales bacterium]
MNALSYREDAPSWLHATRRLGGTVSAPADDVARFRAAFERHYDAVLAYALRRCPTREDAEEIVASTFTTAWRRIDKLAPEPFTLTWLYRVAWRTLANQRRSASRRDHLLGRLGRLRTSSAAHDLDEAGDQEALVLAALARLKPREQEVLRLVAWEELSYAEAAEVLRCSPNAFAIRLHRARLALKHELAALSTPRAPAGAGDTQRNASAHA